jgi:hypothetical protein
LSLPMLLLLTPGCYTVLVAAAVATATATAAATEVVSYSCYHCCCCSGSKGCNRCCGSYSLLSLELLDRGCLAVGTVKSSSQQS